MNRRKKIENINQQNSQIIKENKLIAFSYYLQFFTSPKLMNKLVAKAIEEWIAQGKNNLKSYVFYEGYCLDLTNFKKIHPGGSQVIGNYLFKDITHILFSVFPHNQHTTPKILEKYRVGVLNQTSLQKRKKQGTILKQKNNQRENSIMKKSVQFSSEVKKLTSQKQRVEEMKRSKLKNTKNQRQNSIPINTATSEEKKSKRTKNINQGYIQTLKGSKGPKKPKSIEQLLINQGDIKQELKLTKFNSGQIQSQSTVNVSIKQYLKKSWGSIQDFVDQSIPTIKVPILKVRFDRIW